ncbi:MAG: Asp-tRNA(Asn)/Glu-tRNA(Gln) amidotransferase subunit GatA [Candidatus Omnitrophica bacterium]|nr:Asp-tRNA(Asn)/Glu-tRNA(Gln) amidotransferase subunit GatA [Candidatus Omnitrophota bacterium]
MDNLISLTGIEIGEGIKKGELNENEVYFFFKQRIERIDPFLNSFVESYHGHLRCEGNSSLSGVPIAIKDNICINGKKISCASKILSSHIAVYDATVVRRLRMAGLAIIGTTNMDEFAFGSSTENSYYGVTRNPWNAERVSGGSSGGSAAAVAARLVPFALGSDTGGSIRQPSSFCGVIGFKPTYGRVSRYGLIAFASSLDQIGPIATNFIDCASLLNVICGADSKDATSASQEVPDFTKSLIDDVRGIKIGVPKEYFGQGLDQQTKKAIEEALEIFKQKGAHICKISLPHTEYAVAVYYIISSCEASSNLQRFDGIKYGYRKRFRIQNSEFKNSLSEMYKETRGEGFGEETKRRIFLGTYSLSSGYYEAYYLRALKVRRLIKNDFDKVYREVDVIFTPTSPTPAFKIAEKITDPLSMYLSDVYTISANLAGLPAVSFPAGFTKEGLPIGAQFIGREFDEATLIRAGFSYQCSTDYHKKIPKIAHEGT